MHCVNDQPPSCPLVQSLEAWLRALPLTADQTEALEQHKLLCEYVHAADPRVLGNGCRNVPHIVNVMATVMVGADGGGDEDQLADEETLYVNMHTTPALLFA